MQQIYARVYLLCWRSSCCWALPGALPRVRRSTKGEGWERRYFYGTVWAVTLRQTVLLILWKMLPRSHIADVTKLTCIARFAGRGSGSGNGTVAPHAADIARRDRRCGLNEGG